jgi:hypothetical protein
MATLLSQAKAAKHCGIGVKKFREACRNGNGPRVWNPDDGRPMYCDTVLDEWLHNRDDQPKPPTPGDPDT